MSYIYHMKPSPFEGTSLIPLNHMDKDGDLYKMHSKKYVGREELMDGIIPILDCKWNDVVQFSALDPQVIVDGLRSVRGDFEMKRKEYFKIHVDQIADVYNAVIFNRSSDKKKGIFKIDDDEVELFTKSYQEIFEVPKQTIQYWQRVKEAGGVYLMFPYVPHILVKGIIDTNDFQVCSIN